MSSLGNDVLVSYEEDNQQELLYKFLKSRKLEADWADFVYEEYCDSVAQDPPDYWFEDDSKQLGD